MCNCEVKHASWDLCLLCHRPQPKQHNQQYGNFTVPYDDPMFD